MADLPSWVLLSLREPSGPAELVARAAALGVRADVTRDGIQLPGGFLARLEPAPFERRRLDTSLSEEPIALGPATLHVSGGTNDLARGEHSQPAEIRRVARETAARIAAATGMDNGRIESQASRKLGALTELVRALCPLASAVILPQANYITLGAQAFFAMTEEYQDARSYTFPLWSYLKIRPDPGMATIASTGMWVLGLPDVAAALPEGADRRAVVLALGMVQREMVAEGWWPEDGAVFETEQASLRLSRIRDAIWVEPVGAPDDRAKRAARERFGRVRHLGLLLGPHTHHHTPPSAGRVAIEHFLRPDGKSIAVTNGVSAQPQPGGTAEDENDYVELTLNSSELGPWADGWLAWASDYLQGHDGSHPIRPLDRLVLPEPTRGVAGAIVWPMGHLPAEDGRGPTTQLWDLIPFTQEELAAFRAAPTAQRAWMDERLARGDFAAMQARWARAVG